MTRVTAGPILNRRPASRCCGVTQAWALVILLLFPLPMRSETAVQAWVQRYNGPANGDDCAKAMVVDRSNNVIVAGDSASRSISPYNYDWETIKYSGAGVPLWTNRYNGPGNDLDAINAIAVDGSNNVILTGGSFSANASPYNCDCVTIK